jgi:hypothetical protein
MSGQESPKESLVNFVEIQAKYCEVLDSTASGHDSFIRTVGSPTCFTWMTDSRRGPVVADGQSVSTW